MTTAAEKVASSSDLLEEILIRLPAKSLARSKLVSKKWLSEISNPQFLQHQFGHRPNNLPTGMFLTDSKSISSVPSFVSFNDMKPTHQTIPSLGFLYDGIKQIVGFRFSEIKLLKSCNGLLLCIVIFKYKPWGPSSPPKYCVCNPTTKKFRLLPLTPFSLPSILDKDYLAFDPSLSLHYKVICTQIFREGHHPPHGMCIYSSENNCWSTFPCPFDPWREWFLLNGSMYCAGNFFRFDVYTEKIEQITMPPSSTADYLWDNYLPVTSSHVYCIIRKGADLLVFEMNSDFSEWVVSKYQIGVSDEDFYGFHVISVVDGVKEDELDLVLGIPGKLIMYNLKEKTAKELCKLLHDEPDGYRSAQVYQFIECLFFV